MSTFSRTPTLTPSRSPSPAPLVQPDHFFGAESDHLPPSPNSDGKTWLDPEQDPLAHRGIPVFKPTMEEFGDFEGYMSKVECWGKRSGIVKVIPPKEWTDSLPSVKPQLRDVKIKTPIEQHMLGHGGLFRQENMMKRKFMSVREWVELCNKEDFRAPGLQEVGLHSRSANVANAKPKPRRGRKKADTVKSESAGPAMVEVAIKEEPVDDYHHLANGINDQSFIVSPPNSVEAIDSPANTSGAGQTATPSVRAASPAEQKLKVKGRRPAPSKEVREANLAERASRDLAFIDTFEPHNDWLPPNTKPSDYTHEFCQKLERQYWRNCGLGKPAWYGADTMGSLYTDDTKVWNVAHLPSTLSRILPSSDQGLPGVNTPYLYFGMWRATFAWHVEDMDLFSINYIHFGAPKFWYAIPQGRASALESTMRGYFPKDTTHCHQFLRHKSFLASPTLLAQSSCRPNYLVQHAGEFVITYPRGYHAGFNLGLNCAESVNFALDSWLELGRKAKACKCIPDSVVIDVDQLLEDRAREADEPPKSPKINRKVKREVVKMEVQEDAIPLPKNSRKRKSDAKDDVPKLKKIKIRPSASKVTSTASSSQPQSILKLTLPKISVTLKLGPRPVEPEAFPCCLCISMSREGLLKVQDPPIRRKDAVDATGNPKIWMAHEQCANIVPETWVDEIETPEGSHEKLIFGVDGIVKDRWNLKCSACTKNRPKAHGAPVQCTKGKCPKAFHVSCAKEGDSQGIVFSVVREVEKEVVLLEPSIIAAPVNPNPDHMEIDSVGWGSESKSMVIDGALPLNQPSESTGSRVLKIIKKLEVQILCTQHNPAIAAAKKANKQDKIRSDLIALPTMSRIKIRVSAGVFEVSLIRVIEDTKSVEVLWDRGLKREFKWGSVVFGCTDGPVLQKPSEPAAEPERPASVMPVTTYPSVSAATAIYPAGTSQTARTHTLQPPPMRSIPSSNENVAQNNTTAGRYTAPAPYAYPQRPGPYDYWAYPSQGAQYTGAQPQYAYGYNAYYQNPGAVAGPSQHYNPYTYTQTYTQQQYRNGQLHWQQPYQGPQASGTTSYYTHAATSQTATQAPVQGQAYLPPQSHPSSHSSTPTRSCHPNTSSTSDPRVEGSPLQALTPDPKLNGSAPLAPLVPASNQTTHPSAAFTSPPLTSTISGSGPSTEPAPSAFSSPNALSAVEQSGYQDLEALSSLHPSQIAEILRTNPGLTDIVRSAVDQAKTDVP